MMKALRSHATGGPDSLRLDELEIPDVAKDQVLIKVAAAGVNFPDTLIIKDMYQFCLLYTSPSPRDQRGSRMPSSA